MAGEAAVLILLAEVDVDAAVPRMGAGPAQIRVAPRSSMLFTAACVVDLDREWRRVGTGLRGPGRGGGDTGVGVQLAHLVAEHLDPLADVGEPVHVAPNGGEERRRPLEGTFEARFLEGVGVVALPGRAEEQADRYDSADEAGN